MTEYAGGGLGMYEVQYSLEEVIKTLILILYIHYIYFVYTFNFSLLSCEFIEMKRKILRLSNKMDVIDLDLRK